MPAILIIVILLILYGSLYPWRFHFTSGPGVPLWALMHAGSYTIDRRFIADILINLALYVPVGMSGYLALQRIRRPALRVALPVLLGFLLSVFVEVLQWYIPGRRSSVLDVVNNTIGSLLGAAGGVMFESVSTRRFGRVHVEADRRALALLLTWIGSLVFPLFPVMWLAVYRQKLTQVSSAIQFPGGAGLSEGLVAIASAALSWYAAGLMLLAVGGSARWLWAFVALIPAQFLVISRIPSVAEFAGAVAGTVTLLRARIRHIGWIFTALLILRGLFPFRVGAPHRMAVVPFTGFLEMQWQTGVRVLFEKTWYLGTAIWLLRRARYSLALSTIVVCGVAAGVEIAQVYIPGRVSETTDPLLVILIGLAIQALEQRHGEVGVAKRTG